MALFAVGVKHQTIQGQSQYKVTSRLQEPGWFRALEDNPEVGLACEYGGRTLVHRTDKGWEPVDRIESGLASEQLMDGSYGLWKDRRVHGQGLLGFFRTERPKDGRIQEDEVATFARMGQEPTEVCGLSYDGVQILDKMTLQRASLEMDPDNPEKGTLLQSWNLVGQDWRVFM